MKPLHRFSAILMVCCMGCAPTLLNVEAPQGVADDRDRQVLETVLLSLLTDSDFNMVQVPTKGATIILNDKTPDKTGMIRHEQIAQDIGQGHTIPRQAQNDLLRRNERSGTYDSYFASFEALKFDSKIIVTNVTPNSFERAHPTAQAWVEAWLPGYSKDGTQAIVRAWIGPSDHGAVVTALLRKRADKWVVKWHFLARFV